MKLTFLICPFLILFAACSSQYEDISYSWQAISGREHDIPPIYRAKIPLLWSRTDQISADTTIPLSTFTIDDIRITVHNFPLENRILPQAQISRWKGQLKNSNSLSMQTIPQSHGGFIGYFLEGDGLLAWAMQMGSEHYQNLSTSDNPAYKQMRSDYTIKATGPPEQLKKHKKEIIAFARSFELIEEIPVVN